MSTEGVGRRGDAPSAAEVPLVDHHCHGVIGDDLDRAGFEDLVTEGFRPAPPGTSHLDGPLGLAIRRWCAPVLDLPPFPEPEVYLARRAEIGASEATRRLLRGSRLAALVLDTGYRAEDVLAPEAMARLAGAPGHEVVRLEAVAEAVARGGVGAGDFPDEYERALERAAAGAVGLKSVAAYRGGLAFDPTPPTRPEVVAAAGAWLGEGDREAARGAVRAAVRVTDPVLIRFGIWAGAALARDRGFPIQFHTGYGDPDLTLHLANPSLLTDLVKGLEPLGVTVALLHCYPYHREAGYLAAVFPHVYFDVGLAVTYTGASAGRVVAEALELAPFTKQLYSSDAFGLAELYYLGAVQFRAALAGVLGGWVRDDRCSAAEAERIARLIGSENARRVYRLEA